MPFLVSHLILRDFVESGCAYTYNHINFKFIVFFTFLHDEVSDDVLVYSSESLIRVALSESRASTRRR